VDVTNRTSEVDLTNYVPNGEWELLEARLIRNVVFYSCCPEPFPDLTVTLKIRRKILYYMVNVVLPCVMMSVLTLLVFCLPPESGEKIALGITVLLAFSVFMLAIAEKMPETSESIPLIGKKCFFSFFFFFNLPMSPLTGSDGCESEVIRWMFVIFDLISISKGLFSPEP
jgi:nicotinic acetylcholine receptor